MSLSFSFFFFIKTTRWLFLAASLYKIWIWIARRESSLFEDYLTVSDRDVLPFTCFLAMCKNILQTKLQAYAAIASERIFRIRKCFIIVIQHVPDLNVKTSEACRDRVTKASSTLADIVRIYRPPPVAKRFIQTVCRLCLLSNNSVPISRGCDEDGAHALLKSVFEETRLKVINCFQNNSCFESNWKTTGQTTVWTWEQDQLIRMLKRGRRSEV